MIENNNLYYDKEKQQYYFLDEYKLCDSCGKLIKEVIFIKLGYTGKELNKNYYCKFCFKDKIVFNKLNVSEEVRLALVTNTAPRKSIVIIDKAPLFSSVKEYDVFNVADHNREGEKTKDKTKYAGRESLEGATIGDPKFINLDRDKPLEILDAFKELELIKNAKVEEGKNETETKRLVNLGGLSKNRRENRQTNKKVKWTKQSKKITSKNAKKL